MIAVMPWGLIDDLTSRIAIEATSRLLKKLETPELKIEDTQDKELRVMPEPSSGGGYASLQPGHQAPKDRPQVDPTHQGRAALPGRAATVGSLPA